jgi:hypothetical protein
MGVVRKRTVPVHKSPAVGSCSKSDLRIQLSWKDRQRRKLFYTDHLPSPLPRRSTLAFI